MCLHGRWLLVVVVCFFLACLFFATLSFAGEIHDAIANGDSARVAALLRADPGLVRSQAENPMRDLPLHTAAISNQVGIARMLLDAGAEVDGGDTDGSTPLHDAAVGRKREVAQLLIARGADVNRRDRNGGCALSFAVSGGDSLIVQNVLAAGADLYFAAAPSGNTYLHIACSRGLFGFADRLIAEGMDINVRNARGQTPLNWTCQNRWPDRVEKTIARGGDPTLADTSGMTPLQAAAWSGQPEIARLLLAHGADVQARDHSGSTPLFGAAAHGDSATVRLFLDRGAQANVRSTDGRTPLLAALSGGHTQAVRMLLEAGARTDDRDAAFGWTLLHESAALGSRDVAQLLVEHGADLNAKDNDGRTPLALAEQYGQTGLARYLREHGARGDAKDEPVGLASLSNMSSGAADIWYLGHSGWAIKTRNHFLVFDYGDAGRRSDEPCLSSGDINPAELAGQQVTVFTSHDHGDHYVPGMFDWRAKVPNINYVCGFRPQNLPNNPAYEYIGPHETKTIDGMKVTTLLSDDAGVGFLVDVDGVSVFHPGDHANMWDDMSGPYQGEIDALVQKGAHPDIVFAPLVGCGGGTQMAAALGARYVIENMKPKVLFPMHGGLYGRKYIDFIGRIKEDLHTQTTMLPALCKGDHFRYRNGATS